MLFILTLLLSLFTASLTGTRPAAEQAAASSRVISLNTASAPAPNMIVEEDATLFLSEDDGQTWCYFGEGLPAKTRARDVIEHDGTIYMITYQDVWVLPSGSDKWEMRSANLGKMNGQNSIATNGDLLVIGTEYGGVYTSHNGGKSWSHPLFNIADGGFIRSLFFHEGVLYAGTDIGVYRSFDGATTWSHSKDLAMINVIAEHEGDIYVARQNGVGIYRDGKINWTALTTGWAIGQLYSHDGYLYATTAKQEIYRTRDGAKWEQPDTDKRNLDTLHEEVPAALWSGFLPQLPDDWPLGYLINTSRGWVATAKDGC